MRTDYLTYVVNAERVWLRGGTSYTSLEPLGVSTKSYPKRYKSVRLILFRRIHNGPEEREGSARAGAGSPGTSS